MPGFPTVKKIQDIDPDQQCVYAKRLGLDSVVPKVQHYIQLALHITGHQHVVCGFAEQCLGWWYFHDELKVIELTDALEPKLFACEEHRHLDASHPALQALSHMLPMQDQKIVSATSLDLIPNLHNVTPGKVILFSTQAHQVSEVAWATLQQLRDDQIHYYQLQYQNQLYQELLEEQEALNFAKTKFFSIIAHDLRAPFHGLLGFSEVLAKERQELAEDSIQRIADYLYDTTQSTYELLENLLNWAMAENGRFTCHPLQFRLTDITQIVVEVLHAFAMKKQIHLVQEVSSEVMVYADMNMLTSVLQNLVSNALKFSHIGQDSHVLIRAEVKADHTCIEVHDTGLGMTEKQIERLFQPHTIVSVKGTAGEKGTGLGLVLCKRFIDLNFGKIHVMSKAGEGTTFRLELATNAAQWQQRAAEAAQVN